MVQEAPGDEGPGLPTQQNQIYPASEFRVISIRPWCFNSRHVLKWEDNPRTEHGMGSVFHTHQWFPISCPWVFLPEAFRPIPGADWKSQETSSLGATWPLREGNRWLNTPDSSPCPWRDSSEIFVPRVSWVGLGPGHLASAPLILVPDHLPANYLHLNPYFRIFFLEKLNQDHTLQAAQQELGIQETACKWISNDE